MALPVPVPSPFLAPFALPALAILAWLLSHAVERVAPERIERLLA